MVNRWLHLLMLGGDPWLLPIWAAANEAAREGRVQPLTDELREFGLHVSIRLNVLPRVAQRIMQECYEVYVAAKEHRPEHVFTEVSQGYAFPLKDDLKYRLIADIDSFLFESNSCWELMRKVFRLIRAHVGRPVADGSAGLTDELKRALGGVGQQWFSWLDRHRNFVAHKGTPYLAIDVTNDDEWDLLVMKENLRTFADPGKFFRYTEMVQVAREFDTARLALQTHLIELFQRAGPRR